MRKPGRQGVMCSNRLAVGQSESDVCLVVLRPRNAALLAPLLGQPAANGRHYCQHDGENEARLSFATKAASLGLPRTVPSPTASSYAPPLPPPLPAPSRTHVQFTWLFDDWGVPLNYRHMDGFGVHTFKLINREGRETLCKFHWKTKQGEGWAQGPGEYSSFTSSHQ